MKKLTVLGIMSGTSLDGVDYALCDVDRAGVVLRRSWSAPFPRELERRLHAAARGDLPSHALGQAHHDLGRFYAAHARSGGRLRPQLVGLHGQTVFHNPDPTAPATLQLGEPAYLAERLRVPVVANFRAADIAAGGQGAPLATEFHLAVFGRRGRHVCVNNLGGISNVTSIDWRKGARPKIRAFDTGPANLLLDHAVRHFTNGRRACDLDGAWAARGQSHARLLATWLRHPFFAVVPPKSTGRELFGETFLQSLLRQAARARLSRYDALATLTAFTARSLALNYRLHLGSPPDDVILTGGGAANPVLARLIHGELLPLNRAIKVVTCDTLGWPVQTIEPAAFARLAWLRFHHLPGNLPQTTGAGRAVLCGQLVEP
jgi:anhydro-N-acetylmuramic acid kinase